METIRGVLDDRRRPARTCCAPPGPGDLGWVVQRHGALYAAEYGWDASFEALVARIVADYAERTTRAREAAWIAEVDGEPVGCVLLRPQRATRRAQLRLLLVEPGRAASASAAGWSTSASASRARAGYREWCCGPTTC